MKVDPEIKNIIYNKNNKNYRDLISLIESFKTEKGNKTTNVIDIATKKTYALPEKEFEEFLNLLEACKNDNLTLNFAERQESENYTHSGIMFDFDRYQISETREITTQHIQHLVYAISSTLMQFVDFNIKENGKQFSVYIIQRSEVGNGEGVNAKYKKDGLHILFPEVRIQKNLKKHILQSIVEHRILSKVFHNIPHIESAEQMLDMNSASVPVMFYGSAKPNKTYYPLVAKFSVILSNDFFGSNAIIVNPAECDGNVTNLSLTSLAQKENYSYYYEAFPNLANTLRINSEKNSRNLIDVDSIKENENTVDLMVVNNAQVQYMKKLLELLPLSYATEYNKWFKVICAIAHTSTQYKPLAIWFSHRKPESWNEGEIDKVWLDATENKENRENPLTLRSLMYWARTEDSLGFANAEKYNYVKILSVIVFENNGLIQHAHCAKLLYCMIGDKFACEHETSSGKNYRWFEFVFPHQKMIRGEVWKWRREIIPDNLHLFIVNNLSKVFDEVLQSVKDLCEDCDEKMTKYWNLLIKNITTSRSKLFDNAYQNNTILQAQLLFRERGFIQNLDSDPLIFGCGNGLIHIGEDPKLIDNFHEYRVSLFSTVNYRNEIFDFYKEKFNGNQISKTLINPYMETVYQSFVDIYPEPDVLRFILMYHSTGLDRKRASNLLLLLTGGGSNGKSYTLELTLNTLGDQYSALLKMGLLTGGIERGENANSAQMVLKGKNWGYFDETDRSPVLNTQRLKGIVGGIQTGRDLHSKQETFDNIATLSLASNYDFIVQTTDHGTWRRLYYYKHKVKFCKKPDPTNNYEKIENPNFIDTYIKDPLFREAYLALLVYWYSVLQSKYSGNIKLVPVPTIDAETEKFRSSQDSIHKFILEWVVYTLDETIETPLSVYAYRYQQWFVQYCKGLPMSLGEIMTIFENSAIASGIRRCNNALVVRGYKLRETIDEKLQINEKYISVIHAEKSNETIDIETIKIEKTEILEESDTYSKPIFPCFDDL